MTSDIEHRLYRFVQEMYQKKKKAVRTKILFPQLPHYITLNVQFSKTNKQTNKFMRHAKNHETMLHNREKRVKKLSLRKLRCGIHFTKTLYQLLQISPKNQIKSCLMN